MAAGPAPVELSADCTTCGLEGGVVEVYDALVAACRFGLPATARCKVCGIQHDAVFTPAPPRPITQTASGLVTHDPQAAIGMAPEGPDAAPIRLFPTPLAGTVVPIEMLTAPRGPCDPSGRPLAVPPLAWSLR